MLVQSYVGRSSRSENAAYLIYGIELLRSFINQAGWSNLCHSTKGSEKKQLGSGHSNLTGPYAVTSYQAHVYRARRPLRRDRTVRQNQQAWCAPTVRTAW
eukprot:scpid53377/ scgid23833/ 